MTPYEQLALIIYVGVAFIVAIACTAVWMNDSEWSDSDDTLPPAVAGVFAGACWPLGLIALPFLIVHGIAWLVNTPIRRKKELT